MNKKHLLNLIFLMVSISTIVAQSDDISKLNVMHSLKVSSKHFKEPIKYNVTLPEGYSNNKDKSYYVLFDLHPRSHHFLSGLHDWLSHNGEWPWQKTIIITPADYNSEFAKLFGELRSNSKNQTILDYFENDLLKTIDKNYRTNGFKIFTGFMSNGAFGLYTLINRPHLFNAYIISSPTLANNFGGIISGAQEKLQNDDERKRFLYLSTGNHQYEQSNLASFSQIENILKKISPKNIDWQVHRNTTNNYMSQPIVTTINGIEALFTDIYTNLKADSDISKRGMQAIIDHYKNISQKKYGFAISAEGSLKVLASSLMKKDPKKALSIYHKTVELYPNSAYAFSSLAKAYADMNEHQKAIKYQTIAVEKSKSMIIWHQNNLKNILENYKNQVSK
jgi:tetratricopeptide (TPR) repeat protein